MNIPNKVDPMGVHDKVDLIDEYLQLAKRIYFYPKRDLYLSQSDKFELNTAFTFTLPVPAINSSLFMSYPTGAFFLRRYSNGIHQINNNIHSTHYISAPYDRKYSIQLNGRGWVVNGEESLVATTFYKKDKISYFYTDAGYKIKQLTFLFDGRPFIDLRAAIVDGKKCLYDFASRKAHAVVL